MLYSDGKLITENGIIIESECVTGYKGSGGDIVVPDPVKRIGRVFQGNKSITSIVLPATVTSIVPDAFADCINLESITMPGVKTIGTGAFHGCRDLADINGYVVVKNILFDYFGMERDAVVPDGVTKICTGTFTNKMMKSITFPNTVKTIEREAVSRCIALERIVVPQKCKVSETAFLGCRAKLVFSGDDATTIDMQHTRSIKLLRTELERELQKSSDSMFSLSLKKPTATEKKRQPQCDLISVLRADTEGKSAQWYNSYLEKLMEMKGFSFLHVDEKLCAGNIGFENDLVSTIFWKDEKGYSITE